MSSKKNIIGISGPFAGGKDTVAEYIESNFGFKNISTSEVLRSKIREKGLEPNRENMNKYGIKFRRQLGAGFLVKEALESNMDSEKILLTGLRSPAEVDVLHDSGGKLIEVTADPKLRWERLLERGRAGDFASFEEFLELEDRESSSSDPNSPSTKEVADKADYLIYNNSSIDELKKETDKLIKNLLGE